MKRSVYDSGVKTNDKADQYLKYFDPNSNVEVTQKLRSENVVDVSNNYYDLATDFYEYGWGEGFHFASIGREESRDHSFAKYEYKLALKLQLESKDRVLDAGCGIGGPARRIASFSGAHVTGINCNVYQLKRAKELTLRQHLEQLCTFTEGDYHELAYAEGSFDKAYAIEATCHARSLSIVYSEIFRVLKPGGRFACYEWIMTDKFDPNNAYHRKLKEDILEGDGLCDVVGTNQVHKAIKESGFEVLEARDQALDSEIPWYSMLQSKWTLSGFKSTALGRWMTHIMLVTMETVGWAPKGATKVHNTLCKGADALAAAGVEGIFSPMYLVVLRKPL